LLSAIAFCRSTAAFDRADDAGELDEDAVAHELEDAAMALGDQRLQHVLPAGPERFQRTRLIVRHEAAVPHDIGGENGASLRCMGADDPGLVEPMIPARSAREQPSAPTLVHAARRQNYDVRHETAVLPGSSLRPPRLVACSSFSNSD
jgi:hypothetical protein